MKPVVYKTNASLGHNEFAYLLRLNESVNGNDYLCIHTVNTMNDDTYKPGEKVHDLPSYLVETCDFDITKAAIYDKFLFQHFLDTFDFHQDVDIDVANTLLQSGADISIHDNNGKTVLDHSRDTWKRNDIQELIVSKQPQNIKLFEDKIGFNRGIKAAHEPAFDQVYGKIEQTLKSLLTSENVSKFKDVFISIYGHRSDKDDNIYWLIDTGKITIQHDCYYNSYVAITVDDSSDGSLVVTMNNWSDDTCENIKPEIHVGWFVPDGDSYKFTKIKA